LVRVNLTKSFCCSNRLGILACLECKFDQVILLF
jgi:hypothetical protein